MFACQHELCSTLIKVSYCLTPTPDKAGAVSPSAGPSCPRAFQLAMPSILADTDTNTDFAYLTRLGFAPIHGEHAGFEWAGTIVRPIR
jgi:hypothetical protein